MHDAATRARVSALAAGFALVLAVGVVAYGIFANDLARSVGGGVTAFTAALLLSLAKMRSWTTDARAERARLAKSVQAADDQRTRYVAAQGALMEEERRIIRDLEAERVALRAQADVERARLLQELEDERAQIKIDAYLTGVDHGRRGILNETPVQPGRVVQFPRPGMRERATAHPADPSPVQEAAFDRDAGHP
ncbi:hypothetical protein AB0469_31600 [Streptomyces sp. NPDC093801]|uniref:hypothetical protein n=1 Tax=Streptomyces sp. NPDC093801 TaxID=3155203 RepID=UPI00344F4525